GWRYVEVPFATEAEQADPELRAIERERNGHLRPGYSAAQLVELFRDLAPVETGNAFFAPLQPAVWWAAEKFGAESLRPYCREIFSWAEADVTTTREASSRNEATGVKLLARRR